jgi:hypothetical protein
MVIVTDVSETFHIPKLEPVDGGIKLLRNFGNTNRRGVTSLFRYLKTEGQQASPQPRQLFTGLHGVMSQNTFL